MALTAKSPHHPNYLWEMMQRLGIDPGVLPQWSLSCATALHRCQACTRCQECRIWLDDMAASVVPPDFCPNGDIFFEMQMDQPGPHYGDRSVRMPLRLGGI